MRLFGLKSCDTCKKAMKELQAAGRDVVFVDVREEPLSEAQLTVFLAEFGEAMVNRRSTTWRGLDAAERAAAPLAMLLAYPTLMKRPVIEDGDRRTLGWDAKVRAAYLD